MKSFTFDMALCESRHNIPEAVDGAILPNCLNPTNITEIKKLIRSSIITRVRWGDRLNLYVTGLTVALVEVMNYCYESGIDLYLYHYNKEDNSYYCQVLER